jgi:competence protein ComGC
MNEYLILFVLLAVSLLILVLLVRVLLKMKRIEETAESQAVKLEPGDQVIQEVTLVDIEEDE